MSSYRGEPGWVAQLIARTERLTAAVGKFLDDGGRLRGTPDSTIGVFPSDAGVGTYTPAVPADWDGDVDPGDIDDALDQLAERVTDIEEAPAGGGTGDADKYALYGGTYLRPGPNDSIWYRTIPPDAELVDAVLPIADWFSPEHEIIVQTPAETLESIFTNAVGWTGGDRSPETTDTGDDVPIPNAFVVNDNDLANYPAALLMADGVTIIESQPFNRESAGSNITFFEDSAYRKYDMQSDAGIFGAHGGSQLPALYGSIRTGELAPGMSFIPHLIKLVVPPWYLSQDASANDANPGFRWPASSADTGFDVPSDPQEYTGTVPECRMGSILALSKDFDVTTLTTEMAQIFARTFQIYGGIVCDIQLSDSVAFGMEWSPDHKVYDEVVAAFGHDFDDLTFYGEMNTIITNLFVVDNISEDAQGYFHPTVAVGGGHAIKDEDSVALITRANLSAIGKGIMALDNSVSGASELAVGITFDAIVDDTDPAADRFREVAIASITRVSSTATATSNGHGFQNDDAIHIEDAVEPEYNGVFRIFNVTANTFDYTVSGTPTTPATGTIVGRKHVPIYSTLAEAISHKAAAIFLHSASDTEDIIIASTDNVARIFGEATVLANVPVNLTCNKIGVSFEYLKFDSVRLKFAASLCVALGCFFTGTITPPTVLLDDATGISASDLSIGYDGGDPDHLIPAAGWGIIGSDASGGGEPFSWASGGGAVSGTLSVGTGMRRGTWESGGMSHADNEIITMLGDGHFIIEADDCTILTCRFVSCIGPYTYALIQREGVSRMRVVSSVFLANSTWAHIGFAPVGGGTADYGRHVISACVFDSAEVVTTTYSCIDTFTPSSSSSSARACAIGVSINGCLFRNWSFAAIRQHGFMWNISGNVFEQGTLSTRTYRINNGAGITDTQDTVPFDTPSGLLPSIGVQPYRGLMYIDNELMSYVGNATPFTNVGRGRNQTTPASHLDNAIITPVYNVGILAVEGVSIAFLSVSAGNLFQLCRYPIFASDGNVGPTLAQVPVLSIETSGINGGTIVMGANWSMFSNSAGPLNIDHQLRTGQTIFGHRGNLTQTNIPDSLYLVSVTGPNDQAPTTYPNGSKFSYGRAVADKVVQEEVWVNRTGATSVVGNVVEVDPNNDDSVVNAALVARSTKVAGVVQKAVSNTAVVPVAFDGVVDVNCDTVGVARGDWLATSMITAGLASSVGAAPAAGTGFAIARTAKAGGANGSVRAALRNA